MFKPQSMDIIFYNIPWILWNVFLAIVGVVFGWLIFHVQLKFFKVIFAFIWLIFLPNTIYMITDLYHVPYQLSQTQGLSTILLEIEFILLYMAGIITFVCGLYPLERLLRGSKLFHKRISVMALLTLFIFIISFGVVIGRIQRANSWEIFTNTQKVVHDIFQIATSLEYMSFVVLFTIIGLGIYLSCKGLFVPYLQKILPEKPFQ